MISGIFFIEAIFGLFGKPSVLYPAQSQHRWRLQRHHGKAVLVLSVSHGMAKLVLAAWPQGNVKLITPTWIRGR